MEQGQVTWAAGGVPVSTRFDDPYYSLQDGLAETEHVFLRGNGLPERLVPGFTVAELGVGTGLNLCALARIARCPIRYVGFEAYPLTASEAQEALAAFPQVAREAEELISQWTGSSQTLQVGAVTAKIRIGDARELLPGWTETADAWFLDGFAPAKNPELWESALLNLVGARTGPGGTFATYTAAGAVRRSLEAAGFEVTRIPGFGRKRHMSVGVKR